MNNPRWIKNRSVGDTGEMIAVRTLRERGLRIVAKNWRYKRSEIDIIALDEESRVVHVIEVKSRSDEAWESIQLSLSKSKINSFYNGAMAFQEVNELTDWEVQFDLFVVVLNGDSYTFEYIADLRLSDYL